MELLQINLHHSKLASAALVNKIINSNVSIILVQEPWIDGDGIIQGFDDIFDNFILYYKKENRNRTCILVKKNIKAFLLGNFCSRDLTAVVCERKGGKNVCVVSSYFPYEDEVLPTELFQNLVACDKWDLVVGCDSNAHHLQWGSIDINGRGELLFEYILDSKLEICNMGNKPTFISKVDGRKEVLDITLANSTNNCKVNEWKVLDEVSFSDHCWIHFRIDWAPEEEVSFRNPRKTNWELFTNICEENLDIPLNTDIFDKDKIDPLVDLITDTLNNAFEESCKLVKLRKTKNPPWWNKDISEAMKVTRKLLNRSRRKGISAQEKHAKLILYKESSRKLKYMIRKQKKETWKSFCESIEGVDQLSRFRKILSKSKSTPSYIMRTDGTWTESSDEVLSLLMDTHFPGNVSEPVTPGYGNSNKPSWEKVTNIITEERVRWAIDSFDAYKSPGPDNIIPIMLQKVTNLISPILMKIFRQCLFDEYIPLRWREVKVTFIPKAGKPSHTTAKDFRPISLSSFFLKTMERIIDLEIRSNLKGSCLSDSQHAYLKGKSVETALHSVVSSIEYGLENKIYTLASFVDIEGAFNNVTTQAIRTGLHHIGTEEYLINWISCALENRTINSELGQCQVRRYVSRGTPQGGVISPLLWLVVVNMILKKFDSKKVKVVAYADDLVIIIQGKFLITISELMENALKELKSWCNGCGLNINPAKTELVLFTRNTRLMEFRLPRLDGIELKLSESAKYLGIILDKKLNWNKNLEERRKKAYNALYGCKKCIGKNWGLKPQLVHWIYLTVVRPIITYGSLVWWKGTNTQKASISLQTLQRAACIGITGAFRTTPTDALNLILNLNPLELEIKKTAAMSASRLENYGLFKRRSYGHCSILVNNIFGNVSMVENDKIIEYYDFDIPFETYFPNRDEWANNSVVRLNEIGIFTDGSKTNSGVGVGVFSTQSTELSYKLGDDCTVFQAEVFGILKAAESMKDVSGKDISIYIDSQAAIRAVGSFNIKSRIVKSCREFLKKLASQNNVRLCWIPSHQGYEGNEMADELAKRGTELETVTDNIVLGAASSIKSQFEKVIQEETRKRWESISTCRTTKILWPSLNKGKSKIILSLNKCKLSKITGILTGHCAVRKMLKIMGIINEDTCRYCYDIQAVESVEHLLGECEEISEIRFKHLGQYYFEELEVLRNMQCNKLLDFFDAIKCLEN